MSEFTRYTEEEISERQQALRMIWDLIPADVRKDYEEEFDMVNRTIAGAPREIEAQTDSVNWPLFCMMMGVPLPTLAPGEEQLLTPEEIQGINTALEEMFPAFMQVKRYCTVAKERF